MTDRDHFAAAALTGLLARPDVDADPLEHHFCCEDAYKWADAMLRERCRAGADCPVPDNAANLDAAPAARGDARECTAPVTTGGTQWLNYNANDYVRVKLTAHGRELLKKTLPSYTPPTEDADGWSRWQLHRLMNVFGEYMVMGLPLCFETAIRLEAVPPNLDAAPEAIASGESVVPQPTPRGDSDRTDKAAPRPSEGTGDTPATHATRGEGSERRDGTQEPVAWAVCTPGDGDWSPCYFHEPHAQRCANAIVGEKNVVPLYRHPPCQVFLQKILTLTDAEREAVVYAARRLDDDPMFPRDRQAAGGLRSLLERLG